VVKSHFHASTGLCCTHFLGSHVAPAGALHVALRHRSIRRSHLFHHCHLLRAFRHGSRCRNGFGHILARTSHHGSGSGGGGDGGCQEGSLESAGHSGSPKTNCCKIGFKENYPLPSHSWSSPCCSRALGMCSSCIYARSHQSPEGAPKCDHRVRRATRWLKTNVIGFIAAPQMEMASSRSFSP
jgi:hypothetical protein